MRKKWLFLLITAILNAVVMIVSRLSPEFSELYAAHIYPIVSAVTVRFMSLLPFSAIEIIVILFLLAAIPLIALFIRALIKGRGRRKKIAETVFCGFLSAVSVVLLLFNFGCGINYHRRPFSYYCGLTVTQYSDETLLAVINSLITELEPLCSEIETSDEGQFVMDEAKLSPVSRSSMVALGRQYTALDTYYPNPKPVLLSRFFMSRSLICGVYSPFTFEANYNNDMPDSEKPFTVCHELSHLSGFMREDEANFIAYLACRESGDIDFLYSGYKTALTYAIIAYGRSVPLETYFEMYDNIPAQVQTEIALTNEYWRPFRDSVTAKAAGAVNDAYLKANSQQDGTKSYGRFVDLLIADYLAHNGQ